MQTLFGCRPDKPALPAVVPVVATEMATGMNTAYTGYCWRWRTASNRQTPAATETFRLLTAPAMGMEIR